MKSNVGAFNLRLITTVIALPLVITMICRHDLWWAFDLFIALLAGVGLYEYYALVRAAGHSPETIGGIVAGVVISLTGQFQEPLVTMWALYGGCLLVAALHIVRGAISLVGLVSSVFGVVYVGWFAAHLVLLHGKPFEGPGLVIVLLLAVSLTDSAAYFVGSLIGRHKMAPKVSPKKTWEGAFGGIAAALLGMAVFWYVRRQGFDLFPDWTLQRYLLTGVLLSIVAQIGDLTESCLKRSAGVKDSGVLFPGHGGVLDRCDGYLFAGPVLYYMVTPLYTIGGVH